MSQPNDNAEKPTEPTNLDAYIPPIKLAARMMAEMEDPDDPSGIDWDAWADAEKDRELGL
jgi:hypothetical protein